MKWYLILFCLIYFKSSSGQEHMDNVNIKYLIDRKVHFVILSPHLDDGIWSMGGFMAFASKKGCKIDLITIYTGNPVGLDIPKAQMKELTKNGSMEERKSEDSLASKILGINPIWWDIPSRLYRQPWLKKRTYVFKTPDGNEISKNEWYSILEKRIEELIIEYPEAAIVCNMGVGHMYDHVELFMACINAGNRLKQLDKIYFYEDSYAILSKNRQRHYLLKDYVWEKKNAPEKTSIIWRIMAKVMTGMASGTDIKTCIPNELHESKWTYELINIQNTFDLKIESLSKYESQMKQFGGMKRVQKAFKKYHEYWNNSEPIWYIKQ